MFLSVFIIIPRRKRNKTDLKLLMNKTESIEYKKDVSDTFRQKFHTIDFIYYLQTCVQKAKTCDWMQHVFEISNNDRDKKKKENNFEKTVKCLGWQRWTSSLLTYSVRQQLNPPDFKCFREPGRLLPLRKSNIRVSRCHSWSRPAVTLVFLFISINPAAPS